MDYAKAKAIIEELAPGTIVGPDTGARHINLFKAADLDGSPLGDPFSITLPDPEEAVVARIMASDRANFEHSIAAAAAYFETQPMPEPKSADTDPV